MVLTSALIFSSNGLIVRLLNDATPFQALFYRSLGMSLGLFLAYALIFRSQFKGFVTGIGPVGLFGAFLLGASASGMVFAMFNATVANVVFVSSAIPFFTAALAWLILREKISRLVLVFMAIAFIGISIMVSGGISLGVAFGNMMALASALMYALFVIVIRWNEQTNMTPMVAFAGIWICILVPLFSDGITSIGAWDFALCIFWGSCVAAVGHTLFVMAARNLPGAEVTFIMLLEFVLAPIWVWWAINEVPATTTLVGGTLVIGALIGWTLNSKKKSVSPDSS